MRKIFISNDSDHETVEKCKHIYKALNDIGVPVTVAVFCKTEGYLKEDTQSLEDPEYVEFLKELKARGNEIAFHGYSEVSNTREQFLKGLEIFKEVFGEYPKTYIEHGGVVGHHEEPICKKEAIYNEGFVFGSNYFVADIIIKIFKTFFPTHLTNHNIQGQKIIRDKFTNLPNIQGNIAYTHFGYENKIEGWHKKNLDKNLELLKKLKNQGIKFVTMKEYV